MMIYILNAAAKAANYGRLRAHAAGECDRG